MFTGIVREVGTIAAVTGGDAGIRLEIEAPATAPLVEVGGSVAINGVCLTAERVEPDRLTFHAVPETLSRSTLGSFGRGTAVNLEPALRAGDAMGGHIVQGHVDGLGRVQSIEIEGEGLRVIVEAPADTLRYLVEKGSITVEGVSLTVAELHDDAFGLALVPHTIAATTLARLVPGQIVNLEVDVLAKYVERLLSHRG
ncbi:riboflavin synthase [Gaiella sp.]|uniref:riboflavin synthase n=1 Tax=Gaiella sp. TaxID=2663207 RepID=UPI0032671A23